jgi:hypothetical protein
MRRHCADKAWFATVQPLFSEDGGKNIHHAVIEEITGEVRRRLR